MNPGSLSPLSLSLFEVHSPAYSPCVVGVSKGVSKIILRECPVVKILYSPTDAQVIALKAILTL
jgi:hypothetical protein